MGKITGATALINLNFDLMRKAGINALRYSFGFPFGEDGKTPGKRFMDVIEGARKLRKEGFELLGSTFGQGSYCYDPEEKRTKWVSSVPESIGGYDSEEFYAAAEAAAEYLGRECAELCQYWQVANEPDITIFKGDMTDEQNVRFLISIAKGLKKGNPDAKPGINISFMTPYSEWLLSELYQRADTPFEYVGLDGYMGSWQPGGPDDWIWYIDKAHDITGKPVIINEWGYSTLQSGPNPDPDGKRYYNQRVCQSKEWIHVWKNQHNPEEQADYIRECMKIFAEHPAVIGEFFFRWSDTETCWQCGDPMCPAECAWGIVDVHGNPKPGYYALKESYEKYFKGL
ncbi:MAG: hypothetical protein GX094_03285 [Clostridiales bacterium]|nr:hypothetical protein [Clostridiales bacterium]